MNNRLVLTVSEAAIMLGCSDKEIRRRMRDGLLKEVSTKTRKRVMVSLVSVLEALGTSEATISDVVQQRLDQLESNDSASCESKSVRAASVPQQQGHRNVSNGSLRQPAGSGKQNGRAGQRTLRQSGTSPCASPAYSTRKVNAALERCFAPDGE